MNSPQLQFPARDQYKMGPIKREKGGGESQGSQASLMSYWQLLSARVRGYIFFSVVDTAKMSMFL